MTPRAIDGTLRALADPTRRGVVDLLRSRPRPAGELALALDTSPPALSRHLRVLRREGLVEESRGESDSRLRIYQLRRERFAELQDWLRSVESFWSDQLDAYRAHVALKGKGKTR